MNEAEREHIKQSRRVLRRIHEHLLAAHTMLGVRSETMNMVDVVYHPSIMLASLNYVTPRRKTAWVPGHDIEAGLERLSMMKRVPRVQFIEGLYPPLFAKTLRELNMIVERETPIMAYVLQQHGDGVTLELPRPPQGMTVEVVGDDRGHDYWRDSSRDTFVDYDVATFGVEPLLIVPNAGLLDKNMQLDIMVQDSGLPIGIARLSIQGKTAHILALALTKTGRNPDVAHLLRVGATLIALRRGCTLVFAPGHTDEDRYMLRKAGFGDYGSIILYTVGSSHQPEESNNRVLEQSVLSLRP
ncbi:MAG: hypothetical protein D6737_09750 [Chloroflexi bacterium]|nr:MAG: hypothetical protein CUN54_05765 [Phototrophicales bacterium]RMF79948.1 MAG: hypothetical protein D6737_09750 [Chloroflexota bacterium]